MGSWDFERELVYFQRELLFYGWDKALWPRLLIEGRVGLGLWFQRDKSPLWLAVGRRRSQTKKIRTHIPTAVLKQIVCRREVKQ